MEAASHNSAYVFPKKSTYVFGCMKEKFLNFLYFQISGLLENNNTSFYSKNFPFQFGSKVVDLDTANTVPHFNGMSR